MPNDAQVGTTQVSNSHASINLFVPGYGYVIVDIDITSTSTILGVEDVITEHLILTDCVKASTEITLYNNQIGLTVTAGTVNYWFYKGVGVVKESSNEGSETITSSYVKGVSKNY